MPETDSDASADTARFRAFAAQQYDDLPSAWRMRAPGNKIWMLVGAVVVAAILALFLGVALIG
jgi:Tfp pilus assembly protein PilN